MKIKVCGITREEDAKLAERLGAWAIGFVFFEDSPRFVSPRRAREIINALGDRPIQTVGVFVDSPLEQIREAVKESGVRTVQLHGKESPSFCSALLSELPGIQIIKAIAVSKAQDLGLIDAYSGVCSQILLDSKSEGIFGGSGNTFDWELLKNIQARKLILAGGLHSENVQEAIEKVRPGAIDVSSGLEEAPGVKSASKMKAFFSRAKPGRFGEFGGQYAPETLMGPLLELEEAYLRHSRLPDFQQELSSLLQDFAGRETPLTFASRLTEKLGGARIYLKREDLTHTGAHKINNAIGQILLARRMGKNRIIAETGAGQHGVASATVAAKFGMKCVVYMGRVDMERQKPNVQRMKLLGAEVIAVDSGSKTLKDAVSEAMRDWVTNTRDSYYLLGSALGPHPYPTMVRDFQSVIGREARVQILEKEGRLPDELVACVGGGSNAIGLFHPFLGDPSVAMTGVEAGGRAILPGQHAARFSGGSPGVLQGTLSYILQTESGQIEPTHSISAGLDYAAVGPEHAFLRARGRASYTYVHDQDALDAFHELTRVEGIIPALESSHAIAYAIRRARELSRDQILLVCLSGRGDKDLATVLGESDV